MTKELFTKYQKGLCTPEESTYVEKKLQETEFLDNFMSQEDWDKTASVSNIPNNPELLDKIYIRIQNNTKRKTKQFYVIAGVAAAVILLFTIPLYLFNTSSTQQVVSLQNKITTPNLSNLIHINSSNRNMELICSDNSIITLYPNSEVRYVENFDNSNERIIYLKGTAKFKVTKNKNKPFRVVSEGLTTTALGTTFIVSESLSKKTKVDLIEGKIEIKTNHEVDNKSIRKEITHSGTIVINNKNSRILHELKPFNQANDRESYFLEEANNIHIKNLALDDILSIIEQNYGLDITYNSNKTRNKYFSGIFTNDPNTYQKIINEINYLHKINISYNKH